MCFAAVVPILSFAFSAASSIAEYGAKKAQADAINAAWQRNQVAALAADRDTQQALTLRQMQEADATTQRLQAVNIDDARRQAEAVVSGVANGTGGISLDNLVADISRRSEDNRVTLMENYNATAAQLQRSKVAANDQYIARVNNQPTALEPSPLGAIGGVASAGFRLFGDFNKQDNLALAAA